MTKEELDDEIAWLKQRLDELTRMREEQFNIMPTPKGYEVLGEKNDQGWANTELRPDGQQKGYIALSAEERAKGFVRPIRYSYKHVGRRPTYPTRPLTDEEAEKYKDDGYVLYEEYPEGIKLGRFLTAKDLASGCNTVTYMSAPLAETYAREPSFYSVTFCSHCRFHFPVGADGEFVWDGTDIRVGT